MWRQQFLKIFVASLCSSFIQCPTLSCDATLKDVRDNKTFLLTSNLRFRDDFSPWTYFGLSHTIFISSSYTILIITLFGHPRIRPLGHRPNSYSFNNTFQIIGPHRLDEEFENDFYVVAFYFYFFIIHVATYIYIYINVFSYVQYSN